MLESPARPTPQIRAPRSITTARVFVLPPSTPRTSPVLSPDRTRSDESPPANLIGEAVLPSSQPPSVRTPHWTPHNTQDRWQRPTTQPPSATRADARTDHRATARTGSRSLGR